MSHYCIRFGRMAESRPAEPSGERSGGQRSHQMAAGETKLPPFDAARLGGEKRHMVLRKVLHFRENGQHAAEKVRRALRRISSGADRGSLSATWVMIWLLSTTLKAPPYSSAKRAVLLRPSGPPSSCTRARAAQCPGQWEAKPYAGSSMEDTRRMRITLSSRALRGSTAGW